MDIIYTPLGTILPITSVPDVYNFDYTWYNYAYLMGIEDSWQGLEIHFIVMT